MANPLLDDVRVLDLTRLLPGPFCTRFLAQLGATVIKIEDPDGGDYTRTLAPELFEQVNRGKQSVTLDLRQAADVAAFKQLVVDADVVVESFRPGVMDRMGCSYDELRAINPKLVYAALTGFGQNGPYRDAAGHDVNYLGLAGVLDQTGARDGPPAMANVQIADLAGGGLTCAVGILAALNGGRASGEGAFVDSAMLDGSLALQPVALATLAAQGATQPRGGDTLTGALPNYRVYKCRDGKYLAVGALEPKFFVRLLATLAPFRRDKSDGRRPSASGGAKTAQPATGSSKPSMAERLTDKLKNPAAARRLTRPMHWSLAVLFRSRPRGAWLTLLADADACTTPVLTLEEALQDPQIAARGPVEDTAGGVSLGCPLQFDGHRRPPLPSSPVLGADNDRVLGAAGGGD